MEVDTSVMIILAMSWNTSTTAHVWYLAGNVVQVVFGDVGATSGDGHLLLSYHEIRAEGPVSLSTLAGNPEIDRFVCNPLTGHHDMGLLTQANGGHRCGPPDRFAVAEFDLNGAAIVWFLSEEGKWRKMISMALTELATQAAIAYFRKAEDNVLFMREVAKHRRIGVSEGRLRYAEVSPHDPFLLSSYALDDEGSGWKLEHQVALRQVLADGGYLWQENSAQVPPQIAVLDPIDASVIYMKVGEDVVVVDMHNGKVIGASPLEEEYNSLVPCVLPPWLGSSRIPTAGFLELIEEGWCYMRKEAAEGNLVLAVSDAT
uniref:DUF1618 domain-containing protein n=1 Tax=Aegilops tauschii TaxID=37682 RepID=M8AUE0_AEGTA